MIDLQTDKRFFVTAYPRVDKNRQITEEPEPLTDTLDYLARLLHRTKWLLGGGVAIPLSLGGFYRHHSDFDLLAEIGDFPELYARLRKAGYRLYSRKSIIYKNHGWLFLAETQPDGQLMKWHPRSLCFINPEIRSTHPSLGKLDFYPYREIDNQILTCDKKWTFQKETLMAGKHYHTASGQQITCLNLHYVRLFKSCRGGLKHAIDITAIDEGIEAARLKRHKMIAELLPCRIEIPRYPLHNYLDNPCQPSVNPCGA